MPEPVQTTIHGATEPLRAPDEPVRHEQPPLFAAPETIRGQLAITSEKEESRGHSEGQAAPAELWLNGQRIALELDAHDGRARLNGRCHACKAKHSLLAPTTRGFYGAQVPVGRVMDGRSAGLLVNVPVLLKRCDCGKTVELRRVQGTVAPEIHCDARCENAIGHKCDCACGGLNHGAAHG
jgi:hypothetical protein